MMLRFDQTIQADRVAAQSPVICLPGLLGGQAAWRWLAEAMGPRFAVSVAPGLAVPEAPPHLVAHGTGAFDALRAAAAEPWRVRSLTLIDADLGAALPELAGAPGARADKEMRQTFARFAAEGDAWNAMRVIVDHRIGAGAWARTSHTLRQSLARQTGAIADAHARQAANPLSLRDLAGVVCPVRLITGAEAPRAAHAAHAALAHAVPFARSHTIPGAGALPHVTDPHLTFPAIREFLVCADRQWQDTDVNVRHAA